MVKKIDPIMYQNIRFYAALCYIYFPDDEPDWAEMIKQLYVEIEWKIS